MYICGFDGPFFCFAMSIVLLPNWCEDGMDSQRHRYMRCTDVKIIDGVPCQCTKRVRVSTEHVKHSHQYELPLKGKACNSHALLSFHQKNIKESLAKMIACTNLAASQVENKALKEVVLIAIKAGQDLPTKKPLDIIPDVNRHNIIPIINIAADSVQTARLEKFKNGFASLSLDAGTLIHRHFLDFVISSPSPAIPSIVYDTIEVSRLGVAEYGSIVHETISDLMLKGVRIGSIIGDNHPVQKAALCHFSPSSVIKASQCEAIRAIRFFSCAAHTSSLMLERAVENDPFFSQLDSFLKGTINAINDTPVKRIVGHCPTTAPTRWLSRIRALNWILKREDQLNDSLQHEWITTAAKNISTNAHQGINFMRFESLRVFAHAIYPFHAMIRFFEQDHVTQAYVYPITKAVLQFYNERRNHPLFASYPSIIPSIIEGIEHYIKECYDWPLLILSYLITLEGREGLRKS